MKSETSKENRKQFSTFLLLATSVLVIVLIFTPTVPTWRYLIQSNIKTGQQLNIALPAIFSPNTGQEILPAQVQQMLSLMRMYHVPDYQISNQMAQDITIRQRIVEAAWPIKNDPKSPYLFCFPEEIKNHPNCAVVDQREAVALVHCH